MPVYHIVLFKLKPDVNKELLEKFQTLAHEMVGQVPGLTKMSINTPLPATANRGKGYDMGLVAVLDEPDTVAVYAGHPAHQEVNRIRESICDETLAYDLVYD